MSCANDIIQRAENEPDPLKKINILFSGIIPFSGEKLSFLLMILPVFSLPEGMHIRNCYEKVLTDLYCASVASVLEAGNGPGIFSCPDTGFYARISIRMVNQLWLDISDLVILNESSRTSTQAADLLQMTEQYRIILERILSAPYGSIDLIQLSELQGMVEQIHNHWKKKEQG